MAQTIVITILKDICLTKVLFTRLSRRTPLSTMALLKGWTELWLSVQGVCCSMLIWKRTCGLKQWLLRRILWIAPQQKHWKVKHHMRCRKVQNPICHTYKYSALLLWSVPQRKQGKSGIRNQWKWYSWAIAKTPKDIGWWTLINKRRGALDVVYFELKYDTLQRTYEYTIWIR